MTAGQCELQEPRVSVEILGMKVQKLALALPVLAAVALLASTRSQTVSGVSHLPLPEVPVFSPPYPIRSMELIPVWSCADSTDGSFVNLEAGERMVILGQGGADAIVPYPIEPHPDSSGSALILNDHNTSSFFLGVKTSTSGAFGWSQADLPTVLDGPMSFIIAGQSNCGTTDIRIHRA